MIKSNSCRKNILARKQSLESLAWAIAMSEGKFSLTWVHCNYADLRQQMVRRLRKRYPDIKVIVLDPSVKKFYTTLREQLGNEKPQALIVLGLESVRDIKELLSSLNSVREEFRKHFHFPLMICIDNLMVRQLMRLASDFYSWGTLTELAPTPEELLKNLYREAEELFQVILNAGANHFLSNKDILGERYPSEVDFALKDVERYGLKLTPELEACLQFLRGRDAYVINQLDQALNYYQQSLTFWQKTAHNKYPHFLLERQGVLLFYIGLCHYRKGKLYRYRSENCTYLQESLPCFQKCLERFEQAQRRDLVAKFSSQLGRVLRRLKQWDALEKLANEFQPLHQDCDMGVELAQDYGFLAEVKLNREPPKNAGEAKKLSEKALKILDTLSCEQPQYKGLYLLLLAQSLRQLGQVQAACEKLEEAILQMGINCAFTSPLKTQKWIYPQPEKHSSDSILVKKNTQESNPQVCIKILEELRSIYWDKQEYVKAFEVKQYLHSIEQYFGFRRFIGPAPLQPQSGLVYSKNKQFVVPEIIASGRDKDVERLIARLKENSYKLTVICGASGVGKSSLVNAGLIPQLKHESIYIYDFLPVLVRSYNQWEQELGQALDKALWERGISLPEPPDSAATILKELQRNEERKFRTVLIFDQLEEFLFNQYNYSKQRVFLEFIGQSLNTTYVKVILSIREDFIHYLLPCNDLDSMKIINKNILGKDCLYRLGHLSSKQAKKVISSLTQDYPFTLESNWIDEIVDKLAKDKAGISPIELQILGAQLHDITTPEKYRELGSQAREKLVQRYLETVVQDCGYQEIAWLVLFLLTDESSTSPWKSENDIKKEILRGFDNLTKEREINKIKNKPLVNCCKYKFVIDLSLESVPINLQLAENIQDILYILHRSGLVDIKKNDDHNYYQLIHDYLIGFIRQIIQNKVDNKLLEKIQQKPTDFNRYIQNESREIRKQILNKLIILGSILGSGLFLMPLGINSFTKNKEQQKIIEIQDSINKSQAFLNFNQNLDALKEGIKVLEKIDLKKEKYDEIKKVAIDILQKNVYGIKDFKEYNNLSGHDKPVIGVVFSPDGTMIATASFDNTVKLWNAENGKEIDSIDDSEEKKHTEQVNSVDFSPDGNMIATASFDGTVKLWKVKKGEIQFDKEIPNGSDVFGVKFNPKSKNSEPSIALASKDGTVSIWNIKGELIWKKDNEHKKTVDGVAFSPDGKIVASASWDGTVKVWNAQNGDPIDTLEDDEGNTDNNRVFGVAFHPDGNMNMIATANQDKTAKIWKWNIENKKYELLASLKGHNDAVTRVAFSPDGKMIATTSRDGTIKLWNTNNFSLKQTLKEHAYTVYGVDFYAKQNKDIIIATGGEDGIVKLWKQDNRRQKKILEHDERVESLKFSPDGKNIVTVGEEKSIKFWGFGKQNSSGIEPEIDSGVNRVAFSPDGERIVAESESGKIKIWNSDGERIKIQQPNIYRQQAINRYLCNLYFPKMDNLGVLSSERFCHVSEHTLSFSKSEQRLNALAISDNQILATASQYDNSNTVKLWKLGNSEDEPIDSLENHHQAPVNGIYFSPNDEIIATTSLEDKVNLWKRDDDNLKYSFMQDNLGENHQDQVNGVYFSPKGKIIATASLDSKVNLWELNDDEYQYKDELAGHHAGITNVVFRQDGEMIATMSKDRTVKLWDKQGDLLYTLSGPEDLPWGVNFKPDPDNNSDAPQLLAWAIDDNKVIQWEIDLDPDKLLEQGCEWSADSRKKDAQEESEDRPFWSRLMFWKKESHLCDSVKERNPASIILP